MGKPGFACRSSAGPEVEGTPSPTPPRATRGTSTAEGGGGTLESVPVALEPEPHPPGEGGEQFKTCSGLAVGIPNRSTAPKNSLAAEKTALVCFGVALQNL